MSESIQLISVKLFFDDKSVLQSSICKAVSMLVMLYALVPVFVFLHFLKYSYCSGDAYPMLRLIVPVLFPFTKAELKSIKHMSSFNVKTIFAGFMSL